jgi:hypothetical protein
MTVNDSEEHAIAEFRAWLADNISATMPALNRLAARFQLSAVFIQTEINAEKARRRKPNRIALVTTAPQPDPATIGEDALATYLEAGEVGGTDTVRTLARRFDLSYVYVRSVLDKHGISVPTTRRRRSA